MPNHPQNPHEPAPHQTWRQTAPAAAPQGVNAAGNGASKAKIPIFALLSSRLLQQFRPGMFLNGLALAGKSAGAILLLFTLVAAAGCSLTGYSGGGSQGEYDPAIKPSKGSKPYTIRGKTYYPLASGVGFSEEGIASWYGRDFHGKKTANGEVYDMYAMTAAHKLLPFNTQVKVTNLRNGKSIIMRINDRGPFVEKRVIDLSNTGAKHLDMIGTGTAPVRVESVGAVAGISRGSQEGTFEMKGTFYVQVGAFGKRENASRLVSRIKSSGRNARYYYSDMVNFWRVQVGPYNTLDKAEAAKTSLLGEFPGGFVVAQ